MAQTPNDKIFNANDTMDINELVSLNDDISEEFLDQLQNQVSQNFLDPQVSANNDGALFEEVSKEEPVIADTPPEPQTEIKPKITIDPNIDDNFIKKYKAKLNKQANITEVAPEPQTMDPKSDPGNQENVKTASAGEIEKLTGGNIVERPAEQTQIDYNDSLDYLEGNVKYTKYVIYINPENKDFIESLTVKERKNLINRILREQDDIAMTKKRLNMMQSIIKHVIVAIITIAVAVPIIYYTINTSLEASINNYRHSQSIFKTLYRENGKIRTK